MASDDETAKPARKPRGKAVAGIVYGAFVLIVMAFILSSIQQIAAGVFGEGPSKNGPVATTECASALRDLAGAIDRATAKAANESDPSLATKTYDEAKRPEWDRHTERLSACNHDAASASAAAALLRFDRLAESAVRRSASELGPVRREVDSFIR